MDGEQVEIDFRLDARGRTVPRRRQASPPADAAAAARGNEGEGWCEEQDGADGGDCDSGSLLDYIAKTTRVRFLRGAENDSESSTNIEQQLLDDLLLDCEISDCGLMPRTFWMPGYGFEPRCSLEQMALDVFRHHVGGDGEKEKNIDREMSGAEWWVQIRPSPEKTGRYAMMAADEKKSNEKSSEGSGDMSKDGISFHWDKDEELRLLCGGNTYVHPHLSTVTYLTGIGAPTLVRIVSGSENVRKYTWESF